MSAEGAQIPMIMLILAALLAAGVIMTLWRRVKALSAANAALSMGLPNIKKNSDEFELKTEVGKGTTIKSTIHFNK